jgi:heme-degrading monooxygenase HmoA
VILETAILSIKPGQSAAFEVAMREAKPLIAATPGFQRIEVRACVETPDRYLLLVWWDTLEAHTVGFRQSERYGPWRELLHRFYEPFPLVEHYGGPI